MDFELSDDQSALGQAAADLLTGHAPPERVRTVVDAGGGHDPELWAAMVEQGWPAIAIGEDRGGVGFGWIEATVLLEQSGAFVAPAPILQQLLAVAALGDTAWLDPLMSGELIGTVAARPVTVDDDGRLSGRPEPVIHGAAASVLVVPAADRSGALGLYAVDLRPITRTAEPAMDLTRELAWVELDAVAAERIGGPDEVEAFLDRGATGHAAEMLGAAERAMNMAVEYAKVREQFGVPIGSFQAVKHRCADMLIDVEGMRSAVYYAAWAVAADDPERSIAASTAKCWTSDAARRVMASCLQVHGGLGFTWESDVHLYLKRSQLDQRSFGTASEHRTRLSTLLRGRLASGASII